MARDFEPNLRLAIQCPYMCEHVCDRDNIDYTISRCATNGVVTFIWEFKCKVCGKRKCINQDRFGVVVLSAKRREPVEKSNALALTKPSGMPEKPYVLSKSDVKFLRHLGITADND